MKIASASGKIYLPKQQLNSKYIKLRKVISAVLIVLISLSQISLGDSASAQTAQRSPPYSLGILAPQSESFSDLKGLAQLRRLVEHIGVQYGVIQYPKEGLNDFSSYGAIVVVGGSNLRDEMILRALIRSVDRGSDLIWLGSGLENLGEDTVREYFGLMLEGELNATLSKITYISDRDDRTRVFQEVLVKIEPVGASPEAFFLTRAEEKMSPAETVYKKDLNSGRTYYFAYEANQWWGADLDNPWMRAGRIYGVILDSLSRRFSVRLNPYPNNHQSAFITRIEDVDPLHVGEDWLSRAYDYTDFYSKRGAPLSVSVIPRYIDPDSNLDITLNAPTAAELRSWLLRVVEKGGAIVQHGYTHQVGRGKTGVSPEFFDESNNSWLPYEEQFRRISMGMGELRSAGLNPSVFEAPHYKANVDTYLALQSLGLNIVSHNSDTPFFDRFFEEAGERAVTLDLVNVPETLGFIPLEPPQDYFESSTRITDSLYNMSGLMLFFNHLFNEEAVDIGGRLLDYTQSKERVWYTNIEDLGSFWEARFSAYRSMQITNGDYIAVNIGKIDAPGLTLKLSGIKRISGVVINGEPWAAFGDDYIILPELKGEENTIHVFEDEQYGNHVSLLLLPLSFALSFVVFNRMRKALRRDVYA